MLCFGKLGTIWYGFSFPGAASVFHVSPGLAMYRVKQKWGKREGEDRRLSHVALFLYRIRSQAQLNLEVASGAEKCWSRHLTMIMMNSKWGLVPCGFLISLNYSDQFSVDPAVAPINATGHQLVTLRRSISAEETAQFFDPLMGSKYCTTYFIAFVVFLASLYFLVYRIRCRFPTSATVYFTLRFTSCWHQWQKRRRVRSESSPSSCAVKAHV